MLVAAEGLAGEAEVGAAHFSPHGAGDVEEFLKFFGRDVEERLPGEVFAEGHDVGRVHGLGVAVPGEGDDGHLAVGAEVEAFADGVGEDDEDVVRPEADFLEVPAHAHVSLPAKKEEGEVDFEGVAGGDELVQGDGIQGEAEVVGEEEVVAEEEGVGSGGEHHHVEVFQGSGFFHGLVFWLQK